MRQRRMKTEEGEKCRSGINVNYVGLSQGYLV